MKTVNLRGSTSAQQIKNAENRLYAYGEGRHGKNDHLTHSDKVGEKRAEELRNFADFCERKGYDEKLNQNFTEEKLREYFSERLEDLSGKTAVNKISSFSSMTEGLRETGVTIPVDRDFFALRINEERLSNPPEAETMNRAIDNAEAFISSIERESTRVYVEAMYETGFRRDEAEKLVRNPDTYITRNEDGTATISGMIGKGNHEYEPKEISGELADRISHVSPSLMSRSTIYRDLKEHGHTNHDVRYTHARDAYDENFNGANHDETLKEISEELGHHRLEITEDYLRRS